MKARVTSKVINKGSTKKLTDAAARLSKSARVKIGIPEGVKETDGTPLTLIGAVHEFGDPSHNVPERPFLRNTIRANKANYARLNRINIVRILNGTISAEQALSQLGLMAVGHVRRFIDSNDYKLKPQTIARKGSSRALVDTGGLKGSINYEVETL